MNTFDEREMRLECVRQAVAVHGSGTHSPDLVLATARSFYDFVTTQDRHRSIAEIMGQANRSEAN